MWSLCMQVCMCALMCLSQCAFMFVSVACVYDVMQICRNKYMHANLSARLHVHVTLEWLLQLQRMGVYLVDSGEGPNGPRRWRAGRQGQERCSSKHSFHSQSIRELNMRYDCKGYMPVFLKRSWTVLGSNV